MTKEALKTGPTPKVGTAHVYGGWTGNILKWFRAAEARQTEDEMTIYVVPKIKARGMRKGIPFNGTWRQTVPLKKPPPSPRTGDSWTISPAEQDSSVSTSWPDPGLSGHAEDDTAAGDDARHDGKRQTRRPYMVRFGCPGRSPDEHQAMAYIIL
ncbi:hypothetical protein MKX08_007537 [Trichoderma sp. CBMAI-0020]|nr:hypothetical protein MKX08_007537 [Trichoderma sp. CBMAI-0020]